MLPPSLMHLCTFLPPCSALPLILFVCDCFYKCVFECVIHTVNTTIKALSTFPAPSSTLPLNWERIFLAASQRDAQCSVQSSSSFLPVPICPILSLCMFVFWRLWVHVFITIYLFVLCCVRVSIRAPVPSYLPSSALPSIMPKPTFMHPFTAISLFLACVCLYRERGNHQKLWQKIH